MCGGHPPYALTRSSPPHGAPGSPNAGRGAAPLVVQGPGLVDVWRGTQITEMDFLFLLNSTKSYSEDSKNLGRKFPDEKFGMKNRAVQAIRTKLKWAGTYYFLFYFTVLGIARDLEIWNFMQFNNSCSSSDSTWWIFSLIFFLRIHFRQFLPQPPSGALPPGPGCSRIKLNRNGSWDHWLTFLNQVSRNLEYKFC